jgi:WD40 repeat protein
MRQLFVVACCALALASLVVPSYHAAPPAKPNGPVNLSCNTDANEDDPHLSSDGRMLFYSSDAKGKYNILMSQRPNLRSAWPKGRPLDDVQTKVDDRSVFLSDFRYPQYLYFATKKNQDINNYDIYVAVRQGPRSAYTTPTPINAVDTEEDEKDPWLSADLRRLYFSRKTKDGWRVLVSSRQATTGAAGFGAPVLLKDLPPGFHHPTLTRDGKTMYLQGPLEKDRWGLFVSSWAGGNWSKPEPLPINNEEGPIGDTSPCLSRDGSLLYFASDRPGGKGKMDLWVMPVAKLKKK